MDEETRQRGGGTVDEQGGSRGLGTTRSKDAVAQRWGMEGGAEKDQVEGMQRERPRRPEEKDEGIGSKPWWHERGRED